MARVTRRNGPAKRVKGWVVGHGWSALVAAALLLAGCQSTVSEPNAARQPAPVVQAPPPVVSQPPAGQVAAPIIMMDSLRPAAPRTASVALLVPLSGQHAALGQGLLDAAQLALFDTRPGNLTLLPRDTQGTPDGARAALRSAVEAGAGLVLGPLLGAEANAIRSEAAQANVRVISFSTDFTAAGGGVYVMGFLPFEQVRRVLTAAEQAGTRRVGVLVPRNAYGEAVARAATEADPQLPLLSLSGIARFSPEAGDAAQALAELTGVQPGQPAPMLLPFDGLLIAAGGADLRALLPALQQAGISNITVRLLGTGLWDDPSLAAEPALQGAWYAAPPAAERRAFEAAFTQTYGAAPPRLATLAYDATALAAALAQESGGPRFDDGALTSAEGFAGRDGIFRFYANGLVSRGLAVYEIGPGGAQVVSGAPASFVDLTY